MNNFTKLLVGSVAAVSLVASSLVAVNAQVGDPELDMAVSWMSGNGMTSATSAASFNPAGTLTREQGAKFAAEYAVSNLCLVPDTSRSCTFTDLGSADATLTSSITKSCQLGIFQGSNGQFAPTAPLTKAQLITVIVRAVDGMQDENANPRWSNYHAKAMQLGITKETNVYALDRAVTRYEAALMFYRARVDGCDAGGSTSTGGSDDLSSILEDLFSDDSSDDTTPDTTDDTTDDTTTVDTTTDTVVVTDTTTTTTTTTSAVATCDASIALNPNSPQGNGQEVPGLANVVAAIYDVTAGSDDLLINNLEIQRVGLGNDDAVDAIAVYTLDGHRVSNAKSFNSDDEAYITLNPKVTVPAGSTATLVVVAQVGDSALASNQEFRLRLNTFNSTCDVNLEAGEFEVAAVNAAMVEIDDDGSVSDVELGNSGVEVASFEIDNKDDSDVYITSITLRDDENNAEDNLENFVLRADGETLATTMYASDRYVTFQLADPFLIEDGDTEDFEVLADVVDGAGDQIAFYVDKSLDISGFDDTYGYGLNVNVANYNAQPFSITAGELTFVNHPIPTDQTRADKDDVVLFEFHIDVQAGQDLTWEDVSFDIYSDTPTCLSVPVTSILENIELRDVTNGGTYDLATTAGLGGINCSIEAYDTDLGIQLLDGGEVTFQVIADIAQTVPTVDLGKEFYVEMRPTDATENEIIENSDDERVTDIVPSFLSSSSVEIASSSLQINRLPLSNTNVVLGANDVELIRFEVETDDVSLVTFDELDVTGVSNFNDANISQVCLYRGEYGGSADLLECEDLNGTTIVTFDDFGEVLVPASSTQPMFVTIDIVDDSSNVWNLISASVTSLDAEDDDNDTVPFSFAGTTTVNNITLVGAGTLTLSSAQNAQEVEDDKNVLAGTSITTAAEDGDYVAAFDLDAVNEDIFVENLSLIASPATDFVNAVDKVQLYDDNGTLLYEESVSSNTVTMNNINYTIPEAGTDTVYVRVVTNNIWYQEIGKQISTPFTFQMYIDGSDAEWVDSGDDIGTNLTSPSSEDFYIIPVAISDIDFVSSAAGSTKDTTLSNNSTVAILKITADSWDNTDTNGWDLDLKITQIALNEYLGSATTVATYEISKVGGSETPISVPSVVTAPALNGSQVIFNTSASTNDFELDPGEIAYFKVEAVWVNAAGTSNSQNSVKLEIDSFTSNAIVYEADDAIDGFAPITDPRLSDEFLDNSAVSSD